MFSVDLRIDQFFMVIQNTRQSGYPGRIVLTTALCFTISGLALVTMSRSASHRYHPLLLGTCASIVTALPLAVLVGYTAGIIDIHRWGEYIQMAVYSAIGFISIGVGILAFAWHADRAETPGTAPLLPMLIGIGALTAMLCTWQALEAQERADIKRMIASETAGARSMRSELTTGLERQIHVLQHLARRWEHTGEPLREDWEFEALLNVQDFRGYQAIGWIDPTFHVRWLVPVEGNEGLQRFFLRLRLPIA
jgi:hypothetical protein